MHNTLLLIATLFMGPMCDPDQPEDSPQNQDEIFPIWEDEAPAEPWNIEIEEPLQNEPQEEPLEGPIYDEEL